MGRRRIADPSVRFDTKWHKEGRGYATFCWIWDGAKQGKGYGKFTVRGAVFPAHRWAYERKYGPVDKKLHIDHLCRVPLCVNPEHLEPVTPQENWRRGEWAANRWRDATHCDAGHEFTAENTRYRNDRGWKICRECDKVRARNMRDRRKEEINARRRERRAERKADRDG